MLHTLRTSGSFLVFFGFLLVYRAGAASSAGNPGRTQGHLSPPYIKSPRALKSCFQKSSDTLSTHSGTWRLGVGCIYIHIYIHPYMHTYIEISIEIPSELRSLPHKACSYFPFFILFKRTELSQIFPYKGTRLRPFSFV
mgnify:CR=1 FL=1